jgi:hypothetical protein
MIDGRWANWHFWYSYMPVFVHAIECNPNRTMMRQKKRMMFNAVASSPDT